VRATFWGTRGSLASPGLDTVRYGGNTCCVEVRTDAGDLVVLDAGTGIRRLGRAIPDDTPRVDVLLSHLHMDHIQGLGFFDCLYRDGLPVHLWGPASTTMSLRTRLSRYLSPPLFPVRLRDLPCDLTLHDVGFEPFEVGGFTVGCSLVCHPAPTVGYRLEADGVALTYLSDHEPALGVRDFPPPPEWTSGHDLAHRADLLIHDTQYTDEEYETRVGWGHSTVAQAVAFATAVEAKCYAPFHYDPTHDDATRDAMLAEAAAALEGRCQVIPAREGDTVVVTRQSVLLPADLPWVDP
jgi:ribonuclease BN (tRNA processing enzyme)